MIWILFYLLLVIALILAALLLPRVRFIGEFSPEQSLFKVSHPLIAWKMDLRLKSSTFSVLFLRFHPGNRRKKSGDVCSDTGQKQEPDKKQNQRSSTIEPKETDRDEQSRERASGREPPVRRKKAAAEPKLKQIRERFKTFKTRYYSWLRSWIWQERELITLIAKKAVTFMVRLVKSLRIDLLKADITVATPDPMLTGILFGITGPLTALHKPPRRIISIQADFDRSQPEFDLYCSVSVSPLLALFEMLRLIFVLPWVAIIKVYLRQRKEKKAVAEPLPDNP